MSDVFVSYKREDEARVSRLVRALERAGFSVWWDRGLPGGESWRTQIESALNAAKCVIAVWTHASVAAAGEFVRDEAGRAKSRGALVPVLMDKVSPPLGFGEVQAIDLTHWKRSLRDPFFQDLCAAVQAKLDGREVPPAKGPMKRLVRRLTYSGVATALGGAALALGLNLFGLQDQVCALPLQPQVSDLCGAFGFGGRPTRAERVAWETREPGSCDALRAHIEAFPDGEHRDDAASMISARRVTQKEIWTPSERRLRLFVGQVATTLETEADARAEAMGRAMAAAERLCRGFTAGTLFRFDSATAEPQSWDCSAISGGFVCGFEGEAVCLLEERRVQETETCGD